MNLDYKAIGARVKNFRRERNLSQEKLAELVDVSVPYMSNIETGKKKLSMQVLVNLSVALNATPDELLFGYTSAQEEKSYSSYEAIHKDLRDCTESQAALLTEIIAGTRRGLRTYERERRDK